MASMIDMNNKTRKIKEDFRVMGTDVSVEIVFEGDADEAGNVRAQKDIEGVKEIFSANEKIFSRFREDSELAKINASLGKEIEVLEKDVCGACAVCEILWIEPGVF